MSVPVQRVVPRTSMPTLFIVSSSSLLVPAGWLHPE
jgi:hypothetical protein